MMTCFSYAKPPVKSYKSHFVWNTKSKVSSSRKHIFLFVIVIFLIVFIMADMLTTTPDVPVRSSWPRLIQFHSDRANNRGNCRRTDRTSAQRDIQEGCRLRRWLRRCWHAQPLQHGEHAQLGRASKFLLVAAHSILFRPNHHPWPLLSQKRPT